jgi:NAD(P)-dependent dehydrogenase (short-subunit alcohol dehydrogenase family)
MERRVAVMTGGASLIGLAFSRAWVQSGGDIVVGDRNEDVRDDVDEAIGAHGRYLVGDVTDDGYLAELVGTAVSEFGGLDAVVCAPAIFDDAGYATTRDAWHRALDINLVSAARLTDLALPHLGRGAAVVYIASISGRVAQPKRMVYSTTKAGLLMLARTGAHELAARGIRVNTVSPGWTWSRNMEHRYGTRENADAFAAEIQPLGRMADPEEIADAIMFVLSDRASFMTGADLLIDGGYDAIGPEALGQARAKHPGIEGVEQANPTDG